MTTLQNWAQIRIESRKNRRYYTDVLKAHGVEGRGYMLCTDAINKELLGGRAYEIRAANDLGRKANLRDHLDAPTLGLIIVAESLAAQRIEREMCVGNRNCIEVSVFCARAIASAVANALEADRNAA